MANTGKKSRNSKVLAETASFVFTERIIKDEAWLIISTKDGEWEQRYKEDVDMSLWMKSAVLNPKTLPIAEIWVYINYMCSMSGKDEEFILKFCELINEQAERVVKNSSQPTEEEDAKALADAYAMSEARRKLEMNPDEMMEEITHETE